MYGANSGLRPSHRAGANGGSAPANRISMREICFVFIPPREMVPAPEAVLIEGDFTSWQRHPLVRGVDGSWSTTLSAPNKPIHYRFMLIAPDGTETIAQDARASGTQTLPDRGKVSVRWGDQR